ncbi:hypothetical protein N3K66_002921 [Trichothecium roseum]|uniref:Uncharacterized protein n=1 Tax=Trichothecium roseum TaxID=47278 RepID=A0ACC0V3U1_9HYPO|nr:hypothetical protein N3K66_002921 [Trichothecium roseum]
MAPAGVAVTQGLAQLRGALGTFADQVGGAHRQTVIAAAAAVQHVEQMRNSNILPSEEEWKDAVAEAMRLTSEAAGYVQDRSGEAAKYSRDNPAHAALIAAGVTLLAVPGVITVPVTGILGLVGFTGQGVLAGSTAAAIQSGIGNVVAGSVFAFGQSFAAGGQALAALNGIVQVGGAATSIAGMGGWLKDRMEPIYNGYVFNSNAEAIRLVFSAILALLSAFALTPILNLFGISPAGISGAFAGAVAMVAIGTMNYCLTMALKRAWEEAMG